MMATLRRSLVPLLLALCGMPALAQPVQDVPISAKAAADFTALRERPLFAPDRRAPLAFAPPEPPPVIEAPPVVEPPPPAASAPAWELVGLVRSQRINSAMFRSSGETPEFSLRQGESREGWTLTDIGRFDVTLDSGAGRATLRFPETRQAQPMGIAPLPDL